MAVKKELVGYLYGNNSLLYSGNFTIATYQAPNTIVNVDLPMPEDSSFGGNYIVSITNNDTVSAINVDLKGKQSLGSSAGSYKYPLVATYSIPANCTNGESFSTTGWPNGLGGRLAINTIATACGSALPGNFEVWYV